VIDVLNGPPRGPWFAPAPLPPSVDYSDPQHSLDNGLWLHGERGTIFVNRKKLVGRPIEELRPADEAWIADAMRELYRGRQVVNHMADFFACVRSRGMPLGDVESCHRTASTCHLCNIALRLDRPLEWDPVAEDFVGDAEASRMVSRPQRAGFSLSEMAG